MDTEVHVKNYKQRQIPGILITDITSACVIVQMSKNVRNL